MKTLRETWERLTRPVARALDAADAWLRKGLDGRARLAPAIAFWVVCGNFVLDTLITNASSATNVYVRGISESREELTATLSTGISVNHLISILVALAGGWLVVAVCGRQGFTVDGMRQALAAADPAAKNALAYGYGVLFSISAFMALMNTLFALTIPKPAKQAKAA